MTKDELTLIHQNNIIAIQKTQIKYLYNESASFFGVPKKLRQKNRAVVNAYSKIVKVLNRQFKKALKNCSEELPVEDIPQSESDF